MKQLKKLTREQRKVLIANDLDPKNYLTERDTTKLIVIANKKTKELTTLYK